MGKISRCGAGCGIAITNPPFDLLDLTRDRPSAGGRKEEGGGQHLSFNNPAVVTADADR